MFWDIFYGCLIAIVSIGLLGLLWFLFINLRMDYHTWKRKRAKEKKYDSIYKKNKRRR